MLLSGLALAFPVAALFAFVHQTQARLAAQFPSAAGTPPPVSILWSLLIASLVGMVYGMQWPHEIVLAVGGALFFSGWVTGQRFLRWVFTLMFFGSVSFSTSSLSAVAAARFSVEAFPDPAFLLLLMAAVAGAALLFRHRPRHAPRVIGAATRQSSEPMSNDALFDTLAFSLILLLASVIAASWSQAMPVDGALLGATPFGVGLGIGLVLTLQCAAGLEWQYRGLERRTRGAFSPLVLGVLGLVVLALMGLELRLLGMPLFIGYLVAAGILIANPSINLMPPALVARLDGTRKPPAAKAAPEPPPGRPQVSLRRRSQTASRQ